MKYFKHPQAIVESDSVGTSTRVWAFAHILPGATIGRDCNICDHVFIENDVVVGDRVTIKCGVQLWDGVTIENDVFIGPNATFTNDPFPRSKNRPPAFARTVIREGASIGANATILPGVVVGQHAMVGAGAVLTGNAPANTILVGNPARIIGYSGVEYSPAFSTLASDQTLRTSAVAGVRVQQLPRIEDVRGFLAFGEVHRHIPFDVRRFFLVFDVSGDHVRGEHAHKTLHQMLICVHGQCHVIVDDGTHREEFVLDSPSIGLYIPPMVWAAQYRYTKDAVLMVLASDYYDPDDYIRDHTEFVAAVTRNQ